MGAMPMIMARAVMTTGRKRVNPASVAARTASPVAARRSRAKLMTRMELAVATPMHKIAPVSAGTESVVPVAKQDPDDPGKCGRQGGDDHERIQHDWKFTTISR